MSIFRRGGRWYAYVTVHGRRIRRAAGSRQEALRLEQELRERGALSPQGLEAVLAQHLKVGAKHLRDEKGRKSVARAIRPYLTGKAVKDAPQVAQAMISDWSGTLAVATINRRLALLRRLCNLAYDWGWTDEQHGRRVKLLPGEITRDVYLTRDQLHALAEACQDTGAGSAVLLAGYTGLRRGELLRLDKGDYRDGWLTVRQSKTGKPRQVPVAGPVRHIAESLPLMTTDHHLRLRFERARVAVGMPGLRFHDLRHTCASLLVQAGIPLRTVGEILGHVSVATTRRYAHLAPQHLQDAVALAFGAE